MKVIYSINITVQRKMVVLIQPVLKPSSNSDCLLYENVYPPVVLPKFLSLSRGPKKGQTTGHFKAMMIYMFKENK